MQSAREQLKKLEAEGKYVFHGSDNSELDILEPRQSYDYVNDKQIPDGDPAIFASSNVDYAIFMAIINKKNCPQGHRSSAAMHNYPDGHVDLILRANKFTLNQLTDNTVGYVYIFDKNLFDKKKY